LEKADLAGISSSSFKDLKPCDLLNLECVPEKQILNKLMFFLDEILIALNISEPFRLLNYLQDLSGLFHRYYAQEKIINEDEKLTLSRLYLSKSVMNVLKTGLMLLGVDAPDSM
jgi:arginyl-tRNA synthetase